MIRGTNQEFRFTLPYALSTVSQLRIKFWQDNYNGPTKYRPLPIIKVKEQCQYIDINQCSITLNQEETLRFTDKKKAKVQLRGVTRYGVPFGTKEHLINVEQVADDSIIEGDIVPTPTYDELIVFDGQPIIQGE
jgi:hypothetical protein